MPNPFLSLMDIAGPQTGDRATQGASAMPMSGGITSPGQPTGGGGKRPSNWWAAAGAPLMALLGSALSGGDLGFGEALSAVGQGFAQEKFNQLSQKRQREFEQEGKTIEVAHQAVQNLSKINPNTMQKFPRLQELAMKYQQALADDGKISGKEAGEIVQLYTVAQADMQGAVQAQAFDTKREAHQFDETLATEDIAKALGAGEAMPSFEGPPQSQAQLMGSAQRLRGQQQLGQLRHDTPVETQYGYLKPTEHAAFLREERMAEQQQKATARAERAMVIREQQMNRTISRQDAMMQYNSDLQEWRTELDAAKMEAGQYGWGPEELRLFEATNPRPKPTDYGLTGRAPNPKKSSGTPGNPLGLTPPPR